MLQGLTGTSDTVEGQLCRDPHHRAGITLAELWCPLKPALECVVCGGGWTVLGLKLSTGCVALGPPERSGPRSATTYTLPGTTQHDHKAICRWLLHVLSLEVPR